VPTAIYMVLLSQSEADDNGPFGEVTGFLGTRSMVELPADVLSGIVERSPAGYPIRELVEAERDQAMEEAASGSAEGTTRLLRQPSARRMTADALAKAREAAEAAERNGEQSDMRSVLCAPKEDLRSLALIPSVPVVKDVDDGAVLVAANDDRDAINLRAAIPIDSVDHGGRAGWICDFSTLGHLAHGLHQHHNTVARPKAVPVRYLGCHVHWSSPQ